MATGTSMVTGLPSTTSNQVQVRQLVRQGINIATVRPEG